MVSVVDGGARACSINATCFGSERPSWLIRLASLEPPRFADDEPAVTILHVSDMQFGKNHRFADPDGGFDTLLRRLCDDLDLLARENSLKPDLVALTGDLAEWGMKREFEQVAVFGEGLLRHLKLDPDRLLVIPGNHDINRKLCEAYLLRCAGEGNDPKPPLAEVGAIPRADRSALSRR